MVAAELTAPQPLKKVSARSMREQAAAVLSLSAADIKTDRHPPQVASVGLPFLMVEVASREALRRAKPDATAFWKTFPAVGADAVYFYTSDVPAVGAAARPAGAHVPSGRRAVFPKTPPPAAPPAPPRLCSPIWTPRAMAN